MPAAGVAFFALLAIFPALIAVITLYGIVADPTQAAHQAEGFVSSLPEQAQPIVADQRRGPYGRTANAPARRPGGLWSGPYLWAAGYGPAGSAWGRR